MLALEQTPSEHGEKGYADFSSTGPGTLAGRFLRSFWQPVFVSRQLQAGRATPLRIMGQDYTLYRGSGGTVHLIADRCAHRGTQLSTGWVEEDCIRCFYHGWKYDGSGQCTEQPAEDASFARKVRIPSYPTREYLGLVFAYLGEGQPPAFPRYEHMEDEGVVHSYSVLLPYNYFNHVENSIDPVHVGFVHRTSTFSESGVVGVPTVSAEETDFGLAVYATRTGGAVRQTNFEMPTSLHLKIPPLADEGWRSQLLWQIPRDDFSHCTFVVLHAAAGGDVADRYRQRLTELGQPSSGAELGEAILSGRLSVDEIEEHPTNVINVQDYVAQRGQGVIADRVNERLGRSDVAIILLRKIWTRELRALAEGKPIKQWKVPERATITAGV